MGIYVNTIILLLVGHVWCDFEFTIAHTNDVHARVEEFNKYGGNCVDNTVEECYGGVARRHTVIRDFIRGKHKHVILLDGGDTFQGTIWFNVYKGYAAARFMNYINYDAMAVGNHEFDNGPEVLSQFIKNATNFSVLAANVDVSKEPIWPSDAHLNKSVILERGGKQIGVIGYITTDTKWLSNPGPNIEFYDVITSVRTEAQRLKGLGINILIALGHAGIDMDKKIAQEVTEIDVVVGGHTNTFLYNGEKPLNDKIEGPYPISYTRQDGSKVVVVQDFAYGKYLGNLTVRFNDNGELLSWSGNPIVLSSDKYAQDPTVLSMVKEMDAPILKHRTDKVGRTLVLLDGQKASCSTMECNMGNLVTDAVVRMAQQTPDEKSWATVALGVWNRGGMRNSIDKNISDPITMEDLMSVLPFGNTADIIEIKGKEMYSMFEHSVSALDIKAGRFLQVSGFRVQYNMGNSAGNRVVGLRALCLECRVPRYVKVEEEKVYKVITSGYLLGGGDAYNIKFIKRHQGDLASSSLYNYVKQEQTLATPVEGRIEFITTTNNRSNIFHGEINMILFFLAILCYLFY